MSVKIQEKALKDFLRKTLFEMVHVQNGMFDKPGPGLEEEDPETTIPEEVPVQPAEMMATQLVDQRPPVEDDEFVPDNVDELGRAVQALAGQVPSDQIGQFYKSVVKLINRSVADHNQPKEQEIAPDAGVLGDKPTKEDVYEEQLRRAIRAVLREGNWDDDDDFRYRKDDGPDYAAMDDPPPNNEPDGANLDQIASEFGYAGASGARQDIERMLRRMRYIAEKMGKGDMENLQDFAVQEFIDAMLAGEYIDEDDVTELQKNTGMVKELESFRFFFVGGIMMPAYNEIKRNARKKVEDLISKLGLPAGMNQSLLNQALGEVPKNLDKLETKLLKLAFRSGVNDSDELDAMVDKMKDGFPDLEKAAELEGGLLDLAKERWGKQSKGRRMKALAQALQSTADWQALDK